MRIHPTRPLLTWALRYPIISHHIIPTYTPEPMVLASLFPSNLKARWGSVNMVANQSSSRQAVVRSVNMVRSRHRQDRMLLRYKHTDSNPTCEALRVLPDHTTASLYNGEYLQSLGATDIRSPPVSGSAQRIYSSAACRCSTPLMPSRLRTQRIAYNVLAAGGKFTRCFSKQYYPGMAR